MPPEIAGVLLAGGLSRRMGGGDKTLKTLAGRPVLDHVVARAKPQVAALVLNANGDPARFARYDLPVVPDPVDGFVGPLAGVLAGLEWARAHVPHCLWVTSFATDAPCLPRDLVARLSFTVTAHGADMACAISAGQDHPVFGLWPVRLAGELRRALAEEGVRKVDVWTARYRLAKVPFATEPVDPFFNANTPEDLAEAERLMELGKA